MALGASLAQALCLVLLCAAYAPKSLAQSVLSLQAAYNMGSGFFIYNLQDGYFMGAHESWFLTEASYDYAVANPSYYLFNLTYNRNFGGAPPNFNSSQYFEINMPSTVSGTYLQWNVYGWWNPVDMYFVQSAAYGNTLFSFYLVDPFNYFYAIISQMNGYCIMATGGGHLNVEPCQFTNTGQLFQFINPYGPSPAQAQSTVAVTLPTAFVLPNYFMAYNVRQNAVVGKADNASSSNWGFQESTNLAAAAQNPLFFFNLSFNRAVLGAPTFTEESLFEINCPATASATYLEWNVYGYGTSVKLWNVPLLTELQTNLMWTFTLVDAVNNLYTISPNLFEGANDCVTALGFSSYMITPCDRINTTQLWQFINPKNVIVPITTTTTTKPTTSTTTTSGPPGYVEIQCFADSTVTAGANWQSSVQGSLISAVTTVLSSASSPLSVIAVTAFAVQSGQMNNGQQGSTVSVVLQASTAQLNFLVQQGGGNAGTSTLNLLLLSKGVGRLSSVQIVNTPSGDIPSTPTATSSSSGFFSEGWQVAVFVIVILVAVLIAVAYCAWRIRQRRNELSASFVSSKFPVNDLDKNAAHGTLGVRAPEGEKNIRKNSASLELGHVQPFAGKTDDNPIETNDSDGDVIRLTNASDSAGPDV